MSNNIRFCVQFFSQKLLENVIKHNNVKHCLIKVFQIHKTTIWIILKVFDRAMVAKLNKVQICSITEQLFLYKKKESVLQISIAISKIY